MVTAAMKLKDGEREMAGEERMGDKNLSKMHTVLWTSHISLSHLTSPNKISK